MSSLPNDNNNGHHESEYSFLKLIYTIAKESLQNRENLTRILVTKNGDGQKIIRAERTENEENILN
jgi:hypothetical protein